MEPTTVESVREETLADVASFLQASVDRGAGRVIQSSAGLHRSLVHRLARNPTPIADGLLGHCLRTRDGRIVGVNLLSANPFVQDGRSLIGLVSGNFFVDPEARMQGFVLFRKYLATPGVDFCYATTSNENSGPLWRQLGGSPVPGSDRELFLALDFGALAEEVALRRGLPPPLPTLARGIGPFSGLLRPSLGPARIKATTTEDWGKLAALAVRHRDRARLTPERSASRLRWTYTGSGHETYVCADTATEGWFALSFGRRGTKQQIRIATLFDVVWPPNKIDGRALARSIADACAGRVDAVVFDGTIVPMLERSVTSLRRNEHGFQRAFVRVKNGTGAETASTIELMPSYGA